MATIIGGSVGAIMGAGIGLRAGSRILSSGSRMLRSNNPHVTTFFPAMLGLAGAIGGTTIGASCGAIFGTYLITRGQHPIINSVRSVYRKFRKK